MDALIFARIVGPVLLSLGTVMWLHKNLVLDSVTEMTNHATLRLTASITPLLIGSGILLTAPPVIYDGDYLIYAMGFLCVFSGVFRLFFTKLWLKALFHIGNQTYIKIMSTFILLYGIVLTYHGYYII